MIPISHDPDLERLESMTSGGFETRSTICKSCQRAVMYKRSRWELHPIIDAKGENRLECPGRPFYGWAQAWDV